MDQRTKTRHNTERELINLPPDTNLKDQNARLNSICKFCSELVQLSELPVGQGSHEINVGTLSALRTSTCLNHGNIIEGLVSHSWHHRDDTDVCLMKDAAQRAIYLRFGSSDSHFLVRLPVEDKPPSPGQGLLIDSKWIQERLLKKWKDSCQNFHGSKCDAVAARKTALIGRPSFLVDTKRRCIIRAQPNQTYIALSYVWGACQQLRTVKDNLESLLLPNSLDDPSLAWRIPRTIRDAMLLTPTLDERYLWVDVLCIVQDDEIDKDSQINKMAAIYANATVTIVAAQGEDANFGLRGIEGLTEPRSVRQEILPLGDQYKFINSPIVSASTSKWSTRGWTFQESLLSQRKIIFCGDKVQWQCLCAVWNEDTELDDDSTLVHSRGLRHDGFQIKFYGLLTSSWPDLNAYGTAVGQYSTKNLTYSEDIVPAFSGLTNALASTFEGGFLFGIPVVFFDVGLLWKGNASLERRTSSKSSPETKLPSWSWMGWKGSIHQNSWNTGLHYIKKSDFMSQIYTSRRTIPILQWYTGDESNPRKQAITATSTCTDFSDIGSVNLEPGWSCHPNKTKRESKVWSHWEFGANGMSSCHVMGFHNLREPDYYYVHESDPNAHFWTPVPICRNFPSNISLPPMPLISCTTQRALFLIGEKLGYCSTVSLGTRSGIWAGCLEPDLEIQDDSQTIAICELAIISEGFAYNDNHEYGMDEWSCIERPRSGDKYEFYNVMWIQWLDGIAYRNGLGRVCKEVWDTEDSEKIDLVLG